MRTLWLRSLAGIFLGIVMMTIMMSAAPPPAFGADRTWSDGTGAWSTAGNWGGTEPTSSDNALINNGGTAQITLSGEVASSLYLGYSGSTSGNVSMTAGTLAISIDDIIGNSGSGTFTQSGGTVTVGSGNLIVANNDGSVGTYELSGTGVIDLSVGEYIGNHGTGVFNQTGGTNKTTSICLAQQSGSSAIYNLNGGTLSMSLGIAAINGTGTMNIDGGAIVGTYTYIDVDYLNVGYATSRTGEYTLAAGKTITPTYENVGQYGSGTVTQTGGTNTISNTLAIGANAGAKGTYSITGGTTNALVVKIGEVGTGSLSMGGGSLTAGTIYLGSASATNATAIITDGTLAADSREGHLYMTNATLTQSGGTLSVYGWADVGWASNTSATYNMDGGVISISIGGLTLGTNTNSTAYFNQTGGSVTTPVFNPGNGSNSSGVYNLSGGTLSTATFYNLVGTGTLNMDGGNLIHTGATKSINIDNFNVGYNSGKTGTFALAGSTSITAANENIGCFGSGTLTQTGGTNTVSNTLSIGANAGSRGTYSITGGTTNALVAKIGELGTGNLSVGGGNFTAGTIYVGSQAGTGNSSVNITSGTLAADSREGHLYVSNGTVTQSGGNLNIYNWLDVGWDTGTSSTYTLNGGTISINPGGLTLGTNGNATGYFNQNAGSVTGITIYVGLVSGANGVYTQSGGTNATTNFYVGYGTGSSGTYNYSAGTLTVGSGIIDIGRYGSGTFAQAAGSLTASSYVEIGHYAGASGTYAMTGGTLTTPSMWLGDAGTGTFTQANNSVVSVNGASNYLTIAYATGSSGAYNLNDTASLNANYEVVGNYGRGAFTQNGGTNTIANWLAIGERAGGIGTYTLNAGKLNVGTNLFVGDSGTGTFTQSGGTNTVTTNLYAGYIAGSNGAYNLSGGTLSSPAEYVGYNGTGSFTQDGGVNTASTYVVMGHNAGSSGTYNMNGGTLNTGQLYAGNAGAGTINQTDGLVNSTDQSYGVMLAYYAGATGVYNLSGGTLSAAYETVGWSGTGTFTQSGGTNTSTVAGYGLGIARNAGSVGTYNMNGGTANISDVNAGIYGVATINQTDGLFNVTDASSGLCLGYYGGSTGVYNLTGGTLSVARILQGSGVGTINIDGGTLTGNYTSAGVTNFNVGYATTRSGSFTLASGKTVTVGNETIGYYGTGAITQTGGASSTTNLYVGYANGSSGVYTQSGGTNTPTNFYVGYGTGSSGTYNYNGGTLTVGSGIYNIGNYGTGAFTQGTGTTITTNYVDIGVYTGSVGTYTMNGGTLTTQNMYTGFYGTGAFTQASNSVVNVPGTAGDGGFVLGYYAAGRGTYNLQGNLSAYEQSIGMYGTGALTQTGGTNAVSYFVALGRFAGSSGTYTMNGGTLTVSILYDGTYANGVMNQTSGYVNVTDTSSTGLALGYYAGGTGTYNLSEGILSAYIEEVGYSGVGTFTQTGGTNLVSGQLSVGYQAGSSGTYNMNGGYISTKYFFVGDLGSGVFNQTSGLINSTDAGYGLTLGYAAGVSGTYNLSGGTLSTALEVVGWSGMGNFTQSGGTNTTTYMWIADAAGAIGTYSLNGGTLTVNHSIRHNYSGTGTLNIDGGALVLSGSTIDVTSLNVGYATGRTGEFTLASGKYLNATSAEWIGAYSGSVGSFTQTGGTNTANVWMAVGCMTGSSGTYTMNGGTLNTPEIFVGDWGTGTFSQTNGAVTTTNTTYGLSLGYYTSGSGSYGLEGGTLNAPVEIVGWFGTGSFTQSGGTNTLSGGAAWVAVGYSTGSVGTYTMNGGTANISQLFVGDRGSGTFTQTNGYVSATDATYGLSIGYYAEGSGAYNLSGGSLSAPVEYVGYYGNAAFTQTGGTNNITGTLGIAHFAGSTGTYSISAGKLDIDGSIDIGYQGTGIFTQSGTAVVDVPDVWIGDAAAGRGTYNVNGGILSSTNEYVGYRGTGVLTQAGGTNTAATLYIGYYVAGAVGTYNLNGGTLSVGTGNVVNGAGTGTLNIDGGAFTGNYASIDVDYFNVGYATGKTGSFSLPSGKTIDPTDMTVGGYGNGSFTLSAGNLSATANLYVGRYAGSTGTFTISGGTTGTVSNLYVGTESGSQGTVTQSSGSLSTTNFYVGYATGSLGTFNYSGGVTNCSNSFNIGYYGSGNFVQTGGADPKNVLYIGVKSGSNGTYTISAGTIALNGQLRIGVDAGSRGTYQLSGTGVLDATGITEQIGYGGSGALVQTGGTNKATNVYIGTTSGSVGSYALSGGTLKVSSLLHIGHDAGSYGEFKLDGGALDTLGSTDNHIGSYGTGVFTQTGGAYVTNDNIVLARNGTASMGTYNLSGGTVSTTGNISVGVDGNGTFNQSGGTAIIGANLSMGTNGGASGTYNFTGGAITGAANMIVRNVSGATGTFQGKGVVGLTGTLDNSGRVIADGYGTAATLDMSSFGSVAANFGNTTTNGWFAQNKGKLTLPSLTVATGAHNYNWGEGSGDSNIDMVNSMRFLFTGVTTGGSLSVSLFATDRSEVTSIAGAAKLVGYWDVSAPGVVFGSADLRFRYDDALAAQLGIAEADLIVAHYMGGRWYNVTTTVDVTNKRINADSITSFSPFAIGSGFDFSADTYWTGGTGAWTTAGNWSAGVPLSGDSAYVNNAGTAQISAGGAVAVDLTLGEGASDSGNISMTAGTLAATNEYIGKAGTGTFTQSGGTNQAATVYIGYSTGATGTYNLNGGTLSVGTGGIVDSYGTGILNIDGGALTGTYTAIGVDGFNVGYAAGKNGSFTLAAGKTLTTTELEYIGKWGTGAFTQAGGTNTAWQIRVGESVGSSGTYDMNGGVLSGVQLYSGVSGNGIINQTDGAVNMTSAVVLGTYSGSTGAYNLSGGTLNTPLLYVGSYGTGTFTQTGGTVVNTGWMAVSYYAGSSGIYNMNGGVLNSPELDLCETANTTATFNQTNGLVNLTNGNWALIIGTPSGSTGVYNLSGGTLSVARIYATGAGTSTLNIDGGTLTGSYTSIVDIDNFNVGYATGKNGSFTLASGKTLTATNEYIGQYGTGTFTQQGGTNAVTALTLGSGTYNLQGGLLDATTITKGSGTFSFTGGTLSVDTFNGTLTAGTNSTLSPGASPGLTTINGAYTEYGTLYLEIGATGTPGTNYDAVDVNTGNVTMGVDSVLQLVPWSGFSPNKGDYFDVISWDNGYSFIDNGYAIDNDFGAGTKFTATIGATYLRLTFGYEDLYWNVTSGDWATNTNWNPQVTPTNDYSAYINNSGTSSVTTAANVDVLTIGAGTLNINSGGTLNATSIANTTGTGTVNMDGGALAVSGSSIAADNFNVGYAAGKSGSFTLESGKTLTVASNACIGNYGTGIFTQNGGTTFVSTLFYVAVQSGSNGTYDLRDGALTTPNNEYIGSSGTGTFTQSGGTNTVTGNLFVGMYGGSSGIYTQSGGMTQAAILYVGNEYNSRGAYTQSGGTAKITNELDIGCQARSSGTYSLSGTGVLLAGTEYIGISGTGAFTQSGGTNQAATVYVGYNTGSRGTYTQSGGTAKVAGTLYAGYNAGSIGTYALSGTGVIDASGANEYAGYNAGSFGAFTQSGGTNQAVYIYVGYYGSGAYELSGGNLIATSGLIVGDGGTGTFTQSGGTSQVLNLFIGRDSGRLGSYTQTGGTTKVSGALYVARYAGSIGTYSLSGTGMLDTTGQTEYIGYEGTGAFTQSGGTNQAATVYVGYNTGSRGTYTQSGGTTKVTNTLYAGYNAGSIGTYELSGTGVLDATGKTEYVGYSGSGIFKQSGGTNKVDNIYIGNNPGSNGTYIQSGGVTSVNNIFLISYNGTYQLSDTGLLDAAGAIEYVGYYGTGTFTQSGGTHKGYMYVGGSAGSNGTYTQSGGATILGQLRMAWSIGSSGTYSLSNTGVLTVSGGEYISYYGTGAFTQYGGTNQASTMYVGKGAGGRGTYTQSGGMAKATLYAGDDAGAIGTYSLSGTGVLDATGASEYIGNSGTGAFNQSGGTNQAATIYVGYNTGGRGTYTQSGGTTNVTSNLYAGYYAGSIGTYALSGTGSLSATGYEGIGWNGTGTFAQSGGINTPSYLYVSYASGSKGTYDLTGGKLNVANDEYIGVTYSTGTFTQSGGTNQVGRDLYLASDVGSKGAYTQSGGTVKVTRALYIGNAAGSSGTYEYIGGTLTDGTGNANMVVRNNATAAGTFTGAGVVDLSGTLTNNGKVIADGGTLDMSSFTSVTSTIENPTTGGTNGWFATDQGKLILPTLSIGQDAGDVTYWWGESASDSDGIPDLVNSMKLTFHNVTEAGALAISLLAKDSPDTPEDLTVYDTMAYWDFAASPTLEFDSVDILFRYDDSFGYSIDQMKLYWYHDGAWQFTNHTFNDTNKTVLLTGLTGFSGPIMTGPTGPNPPAIPEPVTVLSFIAGMAMLGLRRVFKRK